MANATIDIALSSNPMQIVDTIQVSPVEIYGFNFDYMTVECTQVSGGYAKILLYFYQNGVLTRNGEYISNVIYNQVSELKLKQVLVIEGDAPRNYTFKKGISKPITFYNYGEEHYKLVIGNTLQDVNYSILSKFNGVALSSFNLTVKNRLKSFSVNTTDNTYSYSDYSPSPYAPQQLALPFGYELTGKVSADGETWKTSLDESDFIDATFVCIQVQKQDLTTSFTFTNNGVSETYTYDRWEKNISTVTFTKNYYQTVIHPQEFFVGVTFTDRTQAQFYFDKTIVNKSIDYIYFNDGDKITIDESITKDYITSITTHYTNDYNIDNNIIMDDYSNRYMGIKFDGLRDFHADVFGTVNPTNFLKIIENNLSSISGMNPKDNITSIRFYPIDFDNSPLVVKSTAESQVKLFDYQTSCYGYSLSNNVPQQWFSMNVSGKFNDFRDYEPYSKYVLHLPIFGDIELKGSEIVGRTINGKIALDITTGTLNLFIYSIDRLIYEDDHKIGYDMPFGGNQTNYVKLLSNMGTTILNTATSLVSGGGALELAGVGNDLISGTLNSIKGVQNPTVVKPTQNVNSLHEEFYAYLQRTTVIPVEDETVARYSGRECKQLHNLSMLEGFTVISKPRINCGTENERNEIKDLMRSGIIL